MSTWVFRRFDGSFFFLSIFWSFYIPDNNFFLKLSNQSSNNLLIGNYFATQLIICQFFSTLKHLLILASTMWELDVFFVLKKYIFLGFKLSILKEKEINFGWEKLDQAFHNFLKCNWQKITRDNFWQGNNQNFSCSL